MFKRLVCLFSVSPDVLPEQENSLRFLRQTEPSTVYKPEREMKYPGCLTFTLITPLECAGNCQDLADSLIACYKTMSGCLCSAAQRL